MSINRPVEPKKSASNHREPPPIVLLLDGHSLAYRAFYALPPLTTSAGKPTGAILGFANMVLHLIEEYHPSSLVVTFDAPGRTFRHDLEKEYKAQRKPIPDPLQEQFPGIKDLLSLMGLRWVEQPGYEGDDLIGTLLKKLPLDQLAGIVSSDLDLLQLLDEKTFLLQPIKGVTILKTIDLTVLEKELGLTPPQVVDFIALSGDPSDNIPGVPGIGEKTATRLLRQYASWQGIRDHLADLPPSLQKMVMEHGKQVDLNRQLVVIHQDAPIEDIFPPWNWEGIHWEQLLSKLDEIEMKKLKNRLLKKREKSLVVPDDFELPLFSTLHRKQ